MAEQIIAEVLCLSGTMALAEGRRLDRLLDRCQPTVLFVLVGALTLWVSVVKSWRVTDLVIAVGCFGLAALASWLRTRP